MQPFPRASQSVPERPRATQIVPERPRASNPERPRASQSVPERPRASQSVPECPRASQSVPKRPKASQSVPERPYLGLSWAYLGPSYPCRGPVLGNLGVLLNQTPWRLGPIVFGPGLITPRGVAAPSAIAWLGPIAFGPGLITPRGVAAPIGFQGACNMHPVQH